MWRLSIHIPNNFRCGEAKVFAIPDREQPFRGGIILRGGIFSGDGAIVVNSTTGLSTCLAAFQARHQPSKTGFDFELKDRILNVLILFDVDWERLVAEHFVDPPEQVFLFPLHVLSQSLHILARIPNKVLAPNRPA